MCGVSASTSIPHSGSEGPNQRAETSTTGLRAWTHHGREPPASAAPGDSPISYAPFRCQGKGLMYKGHSREPVEALRSWLIRSRGGSPLRRPREWWRAQLLLYGLDAGKVRSKVSELADKLTNALLDGLEHPTEEVAELERTLNSRFRVQNAEARDRKYQTLDSDESRAEFDPIRFLKERFPVTGKRKKDDLLVLRSDRFPIQSAAQSLGLHSLGVDAPGPGRDRWVIVGWDHGAVARRKLELKEERESWIREEMRRKEEMVAAKRKEVKALARLLEGELAPGVATLRDLVGDWHIESPAISSEWAQLGTEFRMSLYYHRAVDPETSSDGGESPNSGESEGAGEGRSPPRRESEEAGELLWGNFDLGLVRGVLRANRSFSRSESFPSPKVGFSWRGRDFSEGQIQLKRQGENRLTIKFLSSARLKGVLHDCFKKFKFKGYKVSSSPAHVAPSEWDELTAEQWEIECASRWH